MQETVQYQMRQLGDNLREGDVILANHPCSGGSHLPDLTVITPVGQIVLVLLSCTIDFTIGAQRMKMSRSRRVLREVTVRKQRVELHAMTTWLFQVFYPGHERPVFYVASRGHHADIGGITPGSMPPNSRSIFEEGAVFKSFFLVKSKVFQEEGMPLSGVLHEFLPVMQLCLCFEREQVWMNLICSGDRSAECAEGICLLQRNQEPSR